MRPGARKHRWPPNYRIMRPATISAARDGKSPHFPPLNYRREHRWSHMRPEARKHRWPPNYRIIRPATNFAASGGKSPHFPPLIYRREHRRPPNYRIMCPESATIAFRQVTEFSASERAKDIPIPWGTAKRGRSFVLSLPWCTAPKMTKPS